ncbi:hypothetical protein [Pendulispora albinea]|uniref:Uncharacterized protein n=1 Tax=Pendulispora albinea TaxID=2741071 RepID=A0ABZ2LQZ9_9BACT
MSGVRSTPSVPLAPLPACTFEFTIFNPDDSITTIAIELPEGAVASGERISNPSIRISRSPVAFTVGLAAASITARLLPAFHVDAVQSK